MIWKPFLGSVHALSAWVVAAAIVASYWGGADKHRKARTLGNGDVEFAPNRRCFYLWPALVLYMIYSTIQQLQHTQGRLFNFILAACFGILTIMITVSFPEKIILSADGLEQISWLWKSKRIRWEDIVEINTGKKSRMVTIMGANGTKIAHNRQIPDRPRFLLELKQHCGDDLPPDFPR